MENYNLKQKIDIKDRTYQYALETIKFVRVLNKKDFIILTIIKQLLRSATSIGANIIEAQAGSTRKDFINFLNHALKSANESKFWLMLLRDSQILTTEELNKLIRETNEIANILGASLLTLRGRR